MVWQAQDAELDGKCLAVSVYVQRRGWFGTNLPGLDYMPRTICRPCTIAQGATVPRYIVRPNLREPTSRARWYQFCVPLGVAAVLALNLALHGAQPALLPFQVAGIFALATGGGYRTCQWMQGRSRTSRR